uniref:Interferon lambda-4-like n=1 Tax=Camelus bactrianus TaxID=9837 RepID=A0A9W3HCM7_CAMBA|nr:interferon lambda-4-like [Camelus bactrianus]
MGPSGAAAVAMGLWVLVTAGVAGGPGVEAPGRCLLSQYRSLDPRALEAAKALRNRYEEETLSWRPRNCSFHPRRNPPPPSESQDCLEASVMFNLFRLLTRDLKCVASGHLCV